MHAGAHHGHSSNWGACALFLALAGLGMALSHADDANPESLRGLELVRLDATLGVAIVRGPDGEFFSLRQGDATADRAFRLTRLYSDRVELQAVTPVNGTRHRYWLAKGASSAELVTGQPDRTTQVLPVLSPGATAATGPAK
jgi:hypothetical protein